MNKGTKLFSAGVLAGVALSVLTVISVNGVKSYLTPTEEFVNAKAMVADAYGVSSDDVKLYRYEDDNEIWSSVIDINLLSDSTGIYPHYVYTAEVNGVEKILSVEIATKQDPNLLGNFGFCDKTFSSYEKSFEYVTEGVFQPVYIVNVNVEEAIDVPTVVKAIETEIA